MMLYQIQGMILSDFGSCAESSSAIIRSACQSPLSMPVGMDPRQDTVAMEKQKAILTICGKVFGAPHSSIQCLGLRENE